MPIWKRATAALAIFGAVAPAHAVERIKTTGLAAYVTTAFEEQALIEYRGAAPMRLQMAQHDEEKAIAEAKKAAEAVKLAKPGAEYTAAAAKAEVAAGKVEMWREEVAEAEARIRILTPTIEKLVARKEAQEKADAAKWEARQGGH